MNPQPSHRMPAVFLGHGSPMNALEQNRYTDTWRGLGKALPRPRAILAVSAHWYIRGTAVTAMRLPKIIHDFGGFPQALFDMRYPAPGDPALAARVQGLLAPLAVGLDESWGLDHGTWSVLVHVYPQAEIPVVQLSIDATQPAQFHYELGARLRELRNEGVLILGSGNVVHNLRAIDWNAAATGHDWAVRFNRQVRDHLAQGDHAPLIAYEGFGPDARLAIPTPEHYLPLLYVIGLQEPGESISFANDDIQNGSISMLSVVVGGTEKNAGTPTLA
jgi:4,5-DOPA dioxygenase extradiol